MYDLETDPGETTNVASEYPNIVKQLESAYADWNAQLPIPSKAILPGVRSIQTQIDGQSVQLIF